MPEIPPVPKPTDQQPPTDHQPPPGTAKPSEPHPLAAAGMAASVMFQVETGKTPGQFAAGVWEAAKSAAGAVKTIYLPGGMLDMAAQKAVDRAQGIHKPDEAYVSKAEHAKQLDAIISIAATLFPGLGEVKAGLNEGAAGAPGRLLTTPEGVTVHAPAAATMAQAAAGAADAAGVAGKAGVAAHMMENRGAGGGGQPHDGGQVHEGGPGKWENDLTGGQNMNKEQARYQKQITGSEPDRTYHVNGTAFDGWIPGENGKPVTLLEAKHLGDDGRFAKAYESMNRQEFKDFAHLIDRAEKITEQARAQVTAGQGTGARIEWRVSGEKATEAIRVLFGNDPALKDIIVTWKPLEKPPGVE